MRITFPEPEGTISSVAEIGLNRFQVKPLLSHSGSQWFHWCAKVDELLAGESAVIELHWPRVATLADLKNPTKEVIFRMTQQGSFVEALPGILGVSEDLESWIYPECSVHDQVATISLVGTGRPFYIASQMPYTPRHLEKLLHFVGKREPRARIEMGNSMGGLPIHAIMLESENTSAPAVYIQAYQHMTEFTGPWVADRMIRWLIDSDEGNALRRQFTFHIVPVVDMDGLTHGLIWNQACGREEQNFRNKNINRDWEDGQYAEVRVIDRFLRTQIEKGCRYCAGFDFHNGWIAVDNSGACYTIATSEAGTEVERERQKKFVDHLYNSTNHEPAGRYWEHNAPGTFTTHFRALTRAPFAHTVEFSRFIWWNRAEGRFEQARASHHDLYAREMLSALGTWKF